MKRTLLGAFLGFLGGGIVGVWLPVLLRLLESSMETGRRSLPWGLGLHHFILGECFWPMFECCWWGALLGTILMGTRLLGYPSQHSWLVADIHARQVGRR